MRRMARGRHSSVTRPGTGGFSALTEEARLRCHGALAARAGGRVAPPTRLSSSGLLGSALARPDPRPPTLVTLGVRGQQRTVDLALTKVRCPGQEVSLGLVEQALCHKTYFDIHLS